MKSRLWCFTNFRLDFNYEKLIEAGKVKYVKYGVETCPSTGRVHHQGMVWLKGQCGSFKNMGNMLAGSHVEPCKGSWDENDDYISKDGETHEYGVAPA